ncbi:MAG TPA: hypothetical protein VNO82_17935 [Solirubrobacteraceae bacterium]|nr:hypothetical protein [Solirubrobacteraceae bacterium]
MSPGWFPLDDECGPVHGRFLMALRRHALDWPASLNPLHSGAFMLDGVLATYVDVVGDDGEVRSLRVDYDGSLLSADESVGGLGVSGTPDSCAAEGSRWFLEKLRAVR